jgi:hypothetical protein
MLIISYLNLQKKKNLQKGLCLQNKKNVYCEALSEKAYNIHSTKLSQLYG